MKGALIPSRPCSGSLTDPLAAKQQEKQGGSKASATYLADSGGWGLGDEAGHGTAPLHLPVIHLLQLVRRTNRRTN